MSLSLSPADSLLDSEDIRVYGVCMNYQQQATDAIATAEFRSAWPIDVRLTLVRAAQTEGEFPTYAVKGVRWALREARNIERRMAKDITVGEAGLSQADKRRLAIR